jgi:hypothetical protein
MQENDFPMRCHTSCTIGYLTSHEVDANKVALASDADLQPKLQNYFFLFCLIAFTFKSKANAKKKYRWCDGGFQL